MIYRAKSPRRGLEWGDLLILFNRNDCSLSVGVFSSSQICESIAVQFPGAQFLTFVPHGEQTLLEKDSPSSRTTKSSFFSRSAHFGNVSPFLVGATNTFSELIHLFVKMPNCVLKQQPHTLQFVRSPRLFRLSPSSRSRHSLCCRTATSTHFWSPLYVLRFTIYTTFHREATLKTALQLTDHSVKIRVYQIHKEGGVANRFLTARRHFSNPLVRTNSLYGKRTVGFLSLASHALRACEARDLRARKTLMPRFTDFFTDFEKKTDCFAVYTS